MEEKEHKAININANTNNNKDNHSDLGSQEIQQDRGNSSRKNEITSEQLKIDPASIKKEYSSNSIG